MKTLHLAKSIYRALFWRALFLIAPVLVIGALVNVPVYATDTCGVVSTNLLSPVSAGVFPDDSLDLSCRQRDFNWDLKTKVKGDSDLYVTQHIFQSGGQTGWHTHPGPSMITVIEGSLTVYKDDCTSQTYSAGQSFTDIGCGDIHNVVNETDADAKDIAVQIVPHGAPRRNDEHDPGCSQVPACQ